VHRNNILICIQQDATLRSLFYLETALHISGGRITDHQERKQQYLQHLVFVTPLLLSELLLFECAVQHTQTSSNSSTIAADRNNGCDKYHMLLIQLFALLMMGDDTIRNM
jgi:hypothetical protein